MRVLVTGAASGIGRATCLGIARGHGSAAKIAAVDLASAAGLDAAVEDVRKLGAEALPLRADMASAVYARAGFVEVSRTTARRNDVELPVVVMELA